MESKKDIRKRVLERRSILTDIEWKERSHKIFEKVVSHPFFLQSDAVYCYVDYQNEVETRAIMSQAWSLGKKVAVPKVIGDDMDFFYIRDFGELENGYKGISEPKGTNLATEKNVLVIMPGAVFDKNCNRIGYGKGFYDKYLSNHLQFKTIAIAFELQIVESIPANAHDIRPDIIITEENLYDRKFTK